jgi:hypothetical protein
MGAGATGDDPAVPNTVASAAASLLDGGERDGGASDTVSAAATATKHKLLIIIVRSLTTQTKSLLSRALSTSVLSRADYMFLCGLANLCVGLGQED